MGSVPHLPLYTGLKTPPTCPMPPPAATSVAPSAPSAFPFPGSFLTTREAQVAGRGSRRERLGMWARAGWRGGPTLLLVCPPGGPLPAWLGGAEAASGSWPGSRVDPPAATCRRRRAYLSRIAFLQTDKDRITMHCDDSIPAIPLWIDGHAWFGVFSEFIDIREADGSVNSVSRSCGPGGCHRGCPGLGGHNQPGPTMPLCASGCLTNSPGCSTNSGGDLARLVARETGKPFAAAQIEVARAAAALRDGAGACGITPGEAVVQTVVGDAGDPFVSVVGQESLGRLRRAAPWSCSVPPAHLPPRSPWPNCRLARDFRPAPYACFTAICSPGGDESALGS